MGNETTGRVVGILSVAAAVLWVPTEILSAEIPEQIYNRQQEFQSLDTSGDGLLDQDEYNGTALLFAATDSDKDGNISLQEAEYMVTFAEIPAGSFIMGTDDPGPPNQIPIRNASPAHEVQLDAFLMSSTEITTTQYARFLDEALADGEIVMKWGRGPGRIDVDVAWVAEGAPGTKYEGKPYTALSRTSGLMHITPADHPLLIPEHPLNQSWINYIPELGKFTVDPGFEDWPVAYLKWYGAMAYAERYGLSLPTEAEWEYVASGGKQFKYATGDGTIGCHNTSYRCYRFGPAKNSTTVVDTPEEFIGYRIDVGSFPPNPFGVYDLAGSLWEWTLDWYRDDMYQYRVDNGITRNPVNLDGEEAPPDAVPSMIGGRMRYTQGVRSMRGGSYNYHESSTQTAFRHQSVGRVGNDHVGFRVVIRPSTTVFNQEKSP